jgi:hypothetical protein
VSLEGESFRFTPQEGEKGTSEFLAMMAAMVKTSKLRGMVDAVAAAISRDADAAGKSPLFGVYQFLAKRIVFKPDPVGTDQVTAPDTLLARIAKDGKTAGDCDDVATLGASLVYALGYIPLFLVMGKPGDLDRQTGKVKLKHVFYGALVRGAIIPFDPQERVPAGAWPEPRSIGRMEVYEIFSTKPQATGRGTRR